MKISPYVVLFISKKFGCLVYNSITNTFANISLPLYDLLLDAKTNANLINNLDSDVINSLVTAKIITKEIDIQNVIYQKRFISNYHKYQDYSLNLTIAPTTACNFSCPYCYEQGIEHKTMSKNVIEKLINFIESSLSKKVAITWYGGEPLLAINQIKMILDGINKLGDKEIVFQNMITNGYYLTDKNVDFLSQNNIKLLQITLDGATPKSHNSRRHMKDNSGSWDVIINNIDNLLLKNSDIQISLRCNIDSKNKDEFYILRTDLLKRWGNNSNINIYPAILVDFNNASDTDCLYMSKVESTNFLIDQRIENKTLDYFGFTNGGCGATQLNSYVVGPEGEMYKCWNDMGRNDRIIKYLDKDSLPNKDLLFQYMEGPSMFDDEECLSCSLFFVCGGGCQYMRMKNKFENGDSFYCHIAKNNIENYLESYYEQKLNQKFDKESHCCSVENQ